MLVELPPKYGQLVREHLSAFKKLGFFVEEFGESSFIIRTVPVIMGRTLTTDMFAQLIEDFAQEKKVISTEQFKDKIITKMSWMRIYTMV